MDIKTTISVVIPVYNDEKNIKTCLDSILLKQDLPGTEVICVDDGSSDGSLQILLDYQNKHSNVIVISQDNRGLSNARNRGLSIAKGEYVYFVDSDDYLADNMLEKAWKLCQEKDLDVLFFSFESFGDNSKMNEKYHKIIYDTKRQHQYSREVITGREMFCQFCQVNEYHVMVWVQIAKRDFLLRNGIGFCDGILFEDNLYTFMILMLAERTICINDIWYYKRIRENSIVTRPECPENIYGFLKTLIMELDYIKGCSLEISDELKQSLEKVIKNIVLQVHKRFHRLSDHDQIELIHKCSPLEYLILKCILTLADGQLYN